MSEALPNPSRAGWLAACRAPRAVLLEIAWRWGFGLAALAIVAVAAERLMATIAITPGEVAAFKSHDSIMMAGATLHIWDHAGGAILGTTWVIGGALSLLWLGLAAAGRVVTLRTLLLPRAHESAAASEAFAAMPNAAGKPNRAGVLAITFLRVALAWLAVFLCVAVISGAAYTAAAAGASPESPNLALYLLLLAIALPVLLFAWGATNWYLSLAPVFCMAGGAPAHVAIRRAMDGVRMQRPAFLGVSSAYGFLRLAAMILLVIAAAVAVAAVPSAIAAAIIVVLLSLAYFALADFVYIARLAAYLMLLLPSPAASAAAPAAPAIETAGAGFSPELGGN